MIFQKDASGNTRGGLLLVGGAFIFAFSNWFFVWLAQELGGAELLGQYSTLFAVATPLFVAGQLGLRNIFLSYHVALPWKTYSNLQSLGIFLAGTFFFFYIIVFEQRAVLLGLAVLAFKISTSITDLDMARIQHVGRLAKVGWLTILSGFVSFIASATIAKVYSNLALSIFVASLFLFGIAFVTRRMARNLPYSPTLHDRGHILILRASFPVASAQLLASFLTYIPVLYLSVFSGQATAGIYSGIAYVLTASNLAGASLSKFVITPLKNALTNGGKSSFRSYIRSMTIKSFLAGVTSSIVFTAIGGRFFAWLYGPEFNQPAVVLALFATTGLLIILSFLYSIALNVLNNYDSVALSFAAACFLTFVSGSVASFFTSNGVLIGAIMAFAGSLTRLVFLAYAIRKSL